MSMEVSDHSRSSPASTEARNQYDRGLLLADEEKLTDIEHPHHHDVLSGRGVTTNRHPGNESFRSLVALNKELYVSSTKRQKMSISRSIVDAVRSLDPPGRFLEKDPVTGLWNDIGQSKAIEKTSQCLRDGAASLRKQLSADLGDPDFLNAVFGDNEEKDTPMKDAKKTAIEGKDQTGGKASPKGEPYVSAEPSRGKKLAGDKLIHSKKATEAPAKKGHRRTRSNPCSGTATTKDKKRAKPTEQPPSPLARFAGRYNHVPPSPMSPPPRYAHSQPCSPMVWGGGYSRREDESPHSQVPAPAYSYYEHPPSPSSFSPYVQRSSHAHYDPYEYHHDVPPEVRSHHPHSQPWSFSPGWYQPPPSPASVPSSDMQYGWQPPVHEDHGRPPRRSTTPPRPPRSSSPSPGSPLPRGPLPPGRHQFSPAGYTSTPPRPEWYTPREPYSWSHERNEDMYRYSPDHPDDHRYPSEHSPRWRSPYSYDHYSTPPAGYTTSVSGEDSECSGLSVPSLGVDPRYRTKHASSSRVALSPRSRRSYGETPPRPPTSTSPRDFVPPPPSPRFRRIRRPQGFGNPWEREESYRSASPAGEEKKTDYERNEAHQEESTVPYPSAEGSTLPSSLKLKVSERSPRKLDPMEEDNEGYETVLNTSNDTASLPHYRASPASMTRASPLSARISVVAAGTEASAKVDEIAMSPIPMDREDPATLMELPENIMSLPISPCGPHDDPLANPAQ